MSEIPQTECETLVALYESTGGDNWSNNTGWLATNTPCSWHGVTCGDGNVTSLSLSHNQLSGPIPPEIGNLTALTNLSLGDNQLSGPIRPELGNLTALESLELYANQLSGPIPPELGNLIALQYLHLYNNQLSGPIPPELSNLAALRHFSLNHNQLSGPIPPAIGNITALESLALSDNQLSGSIPVEIGNLVALERLYLGSNQLSGPIPPELGNLTTLQHLHLFNNQLSSPIPSEIGNLTALTVLYLSGNPFSGEVPDSLTPLSNLLIFTFYDTDWCVPATGNVPAWLSDIPILYGTGFICGTGVGRLNGAATLADTTPAVGVQVNLYRSTSWPQYWQHISTTHTLADGTYHFTDLGQGLGIDYRVQFVDPTHQLAPQYYQARPTIETATAITITPGVPRTGIDAVLDAPLPPIVDVETPSGSVVYNPDGTAEITIPAPATTPVTLTHTVTCTAGTPTSVTLKLSTGPQYPMTNVSGALYRGIIPAADLGNATVSIAATCDVSTTEAAVGAITLYDPSGIVSNAQTGTPVKGATVTLYNVPGWEPKTGPDDTRPNTCESNLSKTPGAAWSQPAPTQLGMVVNPEVTVTAPRVSYQQTTVDGYYGWDVPQGCWYVVVTAAGYEPFTSPVVGIPPEVTDLDLELTPVDTDKFKVYLPLVLR